MEKSFEQINSVEFGEKQQDNSRIRLEIFRHDEKEPNKAADRSDDDVVRLTQKGREHAREIGKTRNPHPEVAIIYGSPRERTQEAAYHQLFANEDEINPKMSLEEIRKVVDRRLGYGKKEIISEKLNLLPNMNSPYAKEQIAHFKNGNLIPFLFNESDNLARQLADPDSASYSIAAGNVAELVKKYLQILPAWENITKKYPEKYKKFDNEMQRFMGSHQGYLECFLLKAVEKVDGREAAEKITKIFKSNSGLDVSEGYSIIIENNNGKPQITLKYKDREWNIEPKIIDELIKEKSELLEEIKAKNEPKH